MVRHKNIPQSVSGHSLPSANPMLRKRLRSSKRPMILPVGFPDEHVRQAYTNPLVDKSNEKFEWVVPDLNGLRTYARSVFHWDEERINGILLPIMQIVAGKVQYIQEWNGVEGLVWQR
jgi:hypothetical protein